MRSLHVLFALCLIPVMALAADPVPEPSVAPADVLAMEEGIWDAVIEFPPAKPDAAPGRATGVQTNTFVTGRRWIRNDFAVDAKYGGHGTWGYDPVKGKYVGIWVDSNQDYIRFDEGTYDTATRTMTWWSELRQPAPHPPAKYRMREEFRGDTRVLTMTAIGPKSGKEIPLGTITFTRRPGRDPAGL
ncbi:MAG: DUF1579 domain-containing protein [Rhodanobacteraceae bacterium]|jgi:hypothetical protein|nr:DUF1579 domain-containing protein [Rhodanobacteraceae bacterium]